MIDAQRAEKQLAARIFSSFSTSTSTSSSSSSKKLQINGITYTLIANDTTVRAGGARSLQGLWAQASMPLGDCINGSVAYDFGGKHSAAAVTASRTLAGTGRPLDLGLRWAEKGDSLTLDASTKPHPNHKVFAAVDARSGKALLASWLADVAVPRLSLPKGILGGSGVGGGGVSLGVARNFSKNLTSLSATRNIAGAKVNANYTLEDGAAAVTVFRAPLRATVRAKRSGGGGAAAAGSSSWGRPSVVLSVDREMHFDTPWGARAKPAASKQLPKSKGGNPITDSALFRRLGEIDSLWKGKAEEKKAEAPVKSWSFLKRA